MRECRVSYFTMLLFHGCWIWVSTLSHGDRHMVSAASLLTCVTCLSSHLSHILGSAMPSTFPTTSGNTSFSVCLHDFGLSALDICKYSNTGKLLKYNYCNCGLSVSICQLCIHVKCIKCNGLHWFVFACISACLCLIACLFVFLRTLVVFIRE